jgi:ABC-type lipoprotein release transport system permease subunit
VMHVAKYIAGRKVFARHFIGSLQRKITVGGSEVVLTGIMVEIDREAPKAVTQDAQKALKPDEAELGSVAAQRLGLKKGDTLRGDFMLGGRRLDAPALKVVEVRKETGTPQDFRLLIDIGVMQKLLGTGKVVNVIEAVNCVCSGENLVVLAKDLETALYVKGTEEPRGKAFAFWAKAKARNAARIKNKKYANLMTAAVFVFGVLLIGGYSVMNVNERRQETGVLLAIAARPRDVAMIVLAKMVLLAVAGGLIGCWLGDVLCTHFGVAVTGKLHPSMRGYLFRAIGWRAYAWAVAWALLLAVVPSLVGAVRASRTDPAETLRES